MRVIRIVAWATLELAAARVLAAGRPHSPAAGLVKTNYDSVGKFCDRTLTPDAWYELCTEEVKGRPAHDDDPRGRLQHELDVAHGIADEVPLQDRTPSTDFAIQQVAHTCPFGTVCMQSVFADGRAHVVCLGAADASQYDGRRSARLAYYPIADDAHTAEMVIPGPGKDGMTSLSVALVDQIAGDLADPARPISIVGVTNDGREDLLTIASDDGVAAASETEALVVRWRHGIDYAYFKVRVDFIPAAEQNTPTETSLAIDDGMHGRSLARRGLFWSRVKRVSRGRRSTSLMGRILSSPFRMAFGGQTNVVRRTRRGILRLLG